MIIPSLLDADNYKLSMMQLVLHQFPGAEVEYRFHCRTEGVDLTLLLPMLDAEIEHLWMNDRTRIRFARSNWKKLLRRPSAKPCDRSAAAPGRAAHNVNPNRRPHTPAGQHSV